MKHRLEHFNKHVPLQDHGLMSLTLTVSCTTLGRRNLFRSSTKLQQDPLHCSVLVASTGKLSIFENFSHSYFPINFAWMNFAWTL